MECEPRKVILAVSVHAVQWSFEEEAQLIDMVRQHPALWNRHHPSFYSVDKSFLYLQLANRVAIPVEACFGPNGKWKKLCDIYKQRLLDGNGKHWRYMDAMRFLGDNTRNRHYYFRRKASKMRNISPNIRSTERSDQTNESEQSEAELHEQVRDEEVNTEVVVGDEGSSEVSMEEMSQPQSPPKTLSFPLNEILFSNSSKEKPSEPSSSTAIEQYLSLLSARLQRLPKSTQTFFQVETTKFLNLLENEYLELQQSSQRLIPSEESPASKLTRLLASLPAGTSLDPALLPGLLGIT